MKYIVYTEFHKNGMERWFYGTYKDKKTADDVAYQLGHCPEEGYWRCICPIDKAVELGVKNLPDYILSGAY